MSLDRRGTEPGTALVPLLRPTRPPRRGAVRTRHLVWASGLLVALGAGGFGLSSVRSGADWASRGNQVAEAGTTADVLRQLQAEVAQLRDGLDTLRASGTANRQDEAMRGLQTSVEGLRREVEQVRTAGLAPLSSRVEAVERGPGQKMADLQGRVDRLERQVSSPVPTGSIGAPPRPAAVLGQPQAAAVPPRLPPPKPPGKPEASLVPQASDAKATPARPPVVAGWVLRDVYDGIALVEGRAGLREIAPGEYLPGSGEVRSIERHGRSWVVVTSRGTIENSMW